MTFSEGPKLRPNEATAALIVTSDDRYLLQHRDDLPEIFFPGFWGAFGGAVEEHEDVETAMRRELTEELAFTPSHMSHFATLGLDFSFAGLGITQRHFYEIQIEGQQIDAMILGEGQGLQLYVGSDIMRMPNVVPYDATVIWQHLARSRF